jgi:hypothetical protein
MNSELKQTSETEQPDQMHPNEILAEGWRLTRAIMALKGLKIPHYIQYQIDKDEITGADHNLLATRVATLEDLAKAIAALDGAIEQLNQGAVNIPRYLGYRNIEQLNAARNALLELQRRASQGGCSASTTVIEALFPDVPAKKRTAAERAEIERWLAIRKEEGLKIDPETAEVASWHALTFDPYGVMDDWELPEEFHQVDRGYFARAPGSDVWVEFSDLPLETARKLMNKHSGGPSRWK